MKEWSKIQRPCFEDMLITKMFQFYFKNRLVRHRRSCWPVPVSAKFDEHIYHSCTRSEMSRSAPSKTCLTHGQWFELFRKAVIIFFITSIVILFPDHMIAISDYRPLSSLNAHILKEALVLSILNDMTLNSVSNGFQLHALNSIHVSLNGSSSGNLK